MINLLITIWLAIRIQQNDTNKYLSDEDKLMGV